MFYLGVDEAGRGPVLGPLVISCVIFNDEILPFVNSLAIRDSKELSAKKREELFYVINEYATAIVTYILWPDIIDEYVNYSSLNKLELEYMLKGINIFQNYDSLKVFVDSPEKPILFKQKLLNGLLNKNSTELIVENKADAKYKVVGAASIIAKVLRDKFIDEIKSQYGDFGSGYPSDPKTIKYIKANVSTLKSAYFVRKSWKTYQDIVGALF